jgi:hypothetical protein
MKTFAGGTLVALLGYTHTTLELAKNTTLDVAFLDVYVSTLGRTRRPW